MYYCQKLVGVIQPVVGRVFRRCFLLPEPTWEMGCGAKVEEEGGSKVYFESHLHISMVKTLNSQYF